MLEAVIALPEQIFFNTGIATYIWVVTNRKEQRRGGTVQLIDARDMWVKMRKGLGEKRREIAPRHIAEIVRLYGDFIEGDRVKIVSNESLGYRTIVVEQPLRAYWKVDVSTFTDVGEVKAVAKLDDEKRDALLSALTGMEPGTFTTAEDIRARIGEVTKQAIDKPSATLLKGLIDQCLVRSHDAPIIRDRHGDPVPDPDLRDTESVSLTESVEDYLSREVHPWVPDAWCPDPEGKIGYEIPFTRLFYRYAPPRPSAEIKAELKDLEGEIHRLLAEVLT
jgi:type I restriction enzyme M protein